MKKTVLAIIGPALSALLICCFLAFSMSFASVNLTIYPQETNNITVAWPATGLYTLQTNNNLATTNWGAYGGLILSNDGTNSITIEAPMMTEFFRLVNPGAPGFSSPTNISGLTYYWNYNDLPSGPFCTWTDEVSGLVLTNAGGTNMPYNYSSPPIPATNIAIVLPLFQGEPTTFLFPGVSLGLGLPGVPAVSDALTNKICVTSSNFSIWMVIRPQFTNSGTMVLLGDDTSNGIVFSNNVLLGNWGQSINSSLAMNYTNNQGGMNGWWQPYGQTYDIVDSGGNIYSNGVLMTMGIGQPTNNFPFSAIGSMGEYPEFPFQGFIQYIGIWTNTLLTSVDASNLDNWYWTYGVTNITNGLIGWWPMVGNSSMTTITDAWANTTFYFGGTGNSYVSGGPVNNGGLYFQGTGWATNTNVSFADNLPAMTISFWIQSTNLGANNNDIGIINKGNFPEELGSPGWAVSSDSITNVYFGVYPNPVDDGSPWIETLHESVYGPYPIWPIVGDNNWHFIAATYSNSPAGILPVIYIDGAQEPAIYNSYPITNISNIYPVSIGQGQDNGYGTEGNGTVGTMDDLRIYDRQLTIQEVNDLYKWRGQP